MRQPIWRGQFLGNRSWVVLLNWVGMPELRRLWKSAGYFLPLDVAFCLPTLNTVGGSGCLSVTCLCSLIKVGSSCHDISASVQNPQEVESLAERFGMGQKKIRKLDRSAFCRPLSRLSLSQCSDWLTSRQELNQKNSQLFLLAPLLHQKFGMHCQDCQQKYRGFKENPAWCRGWMASPSKTRKGLIESWQPYEGGRKTHSKQRRPSGACDTWGKSVSCNTPQPLSSLSLAHTFFTR